jgi:hypothetical protein
MTVLNLPDIGREIESAEDAEIAANGLLRSVPDHLHDAHACARGEHEAIGGWWIRPAGRPSCR